LCITGEAKLAPMLDQRFYRVFGGDLGSSPSRAQSAMQADAGQHIHRTTATEREVFNHIEAVQFGTLGADVRQEPASRRRLVPYAPTSIQSPAAFENPPNRSQRRHRTLIPRQHLPTNRAGPVF